VSRLVSQAPRQSGRTVEASTFEGLLDFLGGTDATTKAEKYRKVRDRLESFFRWRGLGDASGLADDTLDRVARRVEAGEVRTSTPNAFVVGVARMVALEARRKERKDVTIDDRNLAAPPPAEPEDELRLRALDGCLEGLVTAERNLVLGYYRDEGPSRIEGRAKLAQSLGTTVEALRVRAFRLRARLEQCVQGKLEATK
jgi:DNA-directed RNA polymerase specialized sigma24 family protein